MLVKTWLFFLFAWTWTIILIGVTIYKFIWTDQEDILKHYTSWNWILNTLFFVVERLGTIIDYFNPPSANKIYKKVEFFVYSYLIWPIYGSSWVVFWLVYVIFSQNSDILIEHTKEGGGKYTLGQVILGDRLLHVMPVVALLIYFFFQLPEIIRVVQFWTRGKHIWFYLVHNTLTPLLFLGFYTILFDTRDVYGITLHPALSFLIILSTLIVFVDLKIFVLRDYSINKINSLS